MRLIGAGSLVYLLAMTFAVSGTAHTSRESAGPSSVSSLDTQDRDDDRRDDVRLEGRRSSASTPLETSSSGRMCCACTRSFPAVDPATALAVGLKVDVQALPPAVIAALRADPVDSDGSGGDRRAAAPRRRGGGQGLGQRRGSVDDSRHHLRLVPFVGRQLLRARNRQAPGRLGQHRPQRGCDRRLVACPGRCDEGGVPGVGAWQVRPSASCVQRHADHPVEQPFAADCDPPIYGLKGVGFETFTGDGPISYWNSYVGVGQMGGKGTFNDPRIGLFINQTPDLVTPKLAALLAYQLSLEYPEPPAGSFNREAASRGEHLFQSRARCGTCHRGTTFTDVLRGRDGRMPFLHEPAETGMDPRYAERSATGRYRTTPLRGLLQHAPSSTMEARPTSMPWWSITTGSSN